MSRLDFFSSRFHYTFASHAPTLRIMPGAALRVICPDSDNMLADGSLLAASQRQPIQPPLIEGNPLAGPIFVEGAEPGDCLAVRIDGIELDRDFGQTGLAPRHGLLGDEDAPKHLYRWSIDTNAGIATVINPLGSQPISVPLNPFIGCIGVCPSGSTAVSAIHSGLFGGNMDLPIIRPGATVYFPGNVPGGLLMMGDIHAAQGHGEIIGGGIETSGRVDCTIAVVKGMKLSGIGVNDAEYLSGIGVADDLREAVKRAYANLLDWVVSDRGMNRWDAYNLISQTGSVMIGNLFLPPYPVAARVPKSVLPAVAT